MDSGSFFALLVISVVVAAILHYGLKFYVRTGLTSFISKVIIGYIGASWLGSSMMGQWGPTNGTVYYVPAALGAAAILVLVVDIVKTVHSR